MDTLTRLAGQCAGLRYDSAHAIAIINQGQWDDCWPEVDRAGLLTGRIVGNEDGFFNVDDIAMIHASELTTAEIEDAENSGYHTIK